MPSDPGTAVPLLAYRGLLRLGADYVCKADIMLSDVSSSAPEPDTYRGTWELYACGNFSICCDVLANTGRRDVDRKWSSMVGLDESVQDGVKREYSEC